MTDPVFQNFLEHTTIFLAGSAGMAIVGHAVQSFPTPKNIYWAWFIGVIQFAVGQRYRAANTLAGDKTLTISDGKA